MKRTLSFLLAALICTVTAWAADYTVAYSKDTGTYTATNPAGTWASTWMSTATDPYLKLSVGANNIQVSSGNIYSGASGCTYTLTAQDGYLITGYTIKGTALSDAQTLTPAEGGSAVTFGTSGTSTLAVSGLSASSTSFTQSTPNKGIALSSFTITLTDDPDYVAWSLSLAVSVTGTTEPENTRAGKVTLTHSNGTTVSMYLDGSDTGAQELSGFSAATVTASATSYRGYTFTGFTVDGTDYGTAVEAGELASVPSGSTLVANFTAATGEGINLWYDYSDDKADAYRLPALVRTQKGRLIAFADYRPGNTDVGGGPTSIERRYSDDGGTTWSPAVRVAQGNWGKNTANVIEWSYGDPAVVADNTPGNSGDDVLMICCGGNSLWTSSVYSTDTSQKQQGCVAWRSADGGVTWGGYEYLQPALMQAFVDAGLRAADGSSGIVRSFFTSGKITQSVRRAEGASHNRIYSALVVNGGNAVVFSDDFGQTWKVLGGQIANSGDEAHLVELPDGDLLLVGKGSTSRYVNVFNYSDFNTAAGQWGPTGQWNNAVATSCNGDVEVIPAYDAYGVRNTVVVETAPMSSSPQRREIQYFFLALPKAEGFSTTDFSTVGGASWTQGMNVTHNWAAYSALLPYGDGTVDILFEECATGETERPTGYCLVYQQAHDIKDITARQFFFDKEQAQAEGIRTPRPGHFYRFRGAASGAYLAAGEGTLKTSNTANAATIWYWAPEGLVSYSTGQCLDCAGKALAPVGTGYAAAITSNAYYEGTYCIRTNGFYCYSATAGAAIDRGTTLSNQQGYAWEVEDVTALPVNVTSTGLLSLYSPVGLSLPEGVKAYAATKDEAEGDIRFDKVESVKAGTGVLIKAERGAYSFTVADNEAEYVSDLIGSVLTTKKSSIAANVYTLQSGPAYKLFKGTNLNGFRSHIESEATDIEAFTITLNDETGIRETGIQSSASTGQPAYDLSGRKAPDGKARHGITVTQGHKVLR